MTIKRLFDIAVSLVVLICLWPLFVIGAIAVKLSSPGPALYKQMRVGQHGILFTCYKLRTMFINSEKQGSVTASTDSRITSVGQFLRKYKLDEFPQVWNVLVGKMSFVGPRPDVPGYADKLVGENRKILQMRPGITGLATIFFRYEEEILSQVKDPRGFNDSIIWPMKIKMNLEYLKNKSIITDMGIIVITVCPGINNWLHLVPSSPRTPEELMKAFQFVKG